MKTLDEVIAEFNTPENEILFYSNCTKEHPRMLPKLVKTQSTAFLLKMILAHSNYANMRYAISKELQRR